MSWNMSASEVEFRNDLRKTIGRNIRAVRQEFGLTQIELANRLNKSETMIVKWERGRADIKVADLIMLLKVCHCDDKLDEITGRTCSK